MYVADSLIWAAIFSCLIELVLCTARRFRIPFVILREGGGGAALKWLAVFGTAWSVFLLRDDDTERSGVKRACREVPYVSSAI